MALSQKHFGKILVPWFDMAEWTHVRDLVYSNEIESQLKALDTMKIWKIRMPILSVGIEGTIIILEAMLTDRTKFTEYELTQIYSTAVLRFLNICAGSNVRQGTFYKTASRNELPIWLITLRHDIAHDHKTPSSDMLEIALLESLKWIREKYWRVQENYIKDFTISPAKKIDVIIYAYSYMNVYQFHQKNIEECMLTIRDQLDEIIPHQYRNKKHNMRLMFKLVEDMFYEHADAGDLKNPLGSLLRTLVDEKLFLLTDPDIINGEKRIPRNFRNIWVKLLNVLYQDQTLMNLIHKLDEAIHSFHENSLKEIASLWILELYEGFSKTKCLRDELENIQTLHPDNIDAKTGTLILKSLLERKEEYKDMLSFEDLQKLPISESRHFQNKILKLPNQYTLNYLKAIMKFNDCSEDFIKATFENMKKLVVPNRIAGADEIATVESLHDLIQSGKFKRPSEITKVDDKNLTLEISRKKWRRLEDTSLVRGLPLGRLSKVSN